MEEEIGENVPVKAFTALALDLGSRQTDGQERRGNREFSRSITPIHSSDHHCDLWGDLRGYRKGCNHTMEWADFLSPQPLKVREVQRPRESGINQKQGMAVDWALTC